MQNGTKVCGRAPSYTGQGALARIKAPGRTTVSTLAYLITVIPKIWHWSTSVAVSHRHGTEEDEEKVRSPVAQWYLQNWNIPRRKRETHKTQEAKETYKAQETHNHYKTQEALPHGSRNSNICWEEWTLWWTCPQVVQRSVSVSHHPCQGGLFSDIVTSDQPVTCE